MAPAFWSAWCLCIMTVLGSNTSCTSGTCKKKDGGVLLMQIKPKLSKLKSSGPDPLRLASLASLGSPACCLGCGAWCSPKTGRCHNKPEKSYYKPCESARSVLGALEWSEEFNNTELDESNWARREALRGELRFARGNAFLENGVLKIVAKCEESGKQIYTSAMMSTQKRFGSGRRIEARVRAPAGRGAWPAIWLTGEEGHEIGLMEASGCDSGKVYGTILSDVSQKAAERQGNQHFTDYTQWHTYSIDWLQDKISWYVDGQLYHSFSPDLRTQQALKKKVNLNMAVDVGGSWAGHCLKGRPSCRNSEELGQQQVMEVDYLRVFELEASKGH
ncbi:unnamed protein product [Effrenium voratum]|nr:unnamed protein product [Effrenium voratum]